MKATPLLVVDQVEPTRHFLCERLGFDVVIDVPHGDAVGFCLLQHSGAEIMLQSAASVADDMAALAGHTFRSIVYIDVPDVKALRERLGGVEVVVPLRTTFYGADELFVREPGGNIIGLATPPAEPTP